ncbi:DUF2752 domain-containing protein [Rhodocaloribacter sp.]
MMRVRTWTRRLRRIPPEAVLWTTGLIALACTDPNAESLFGLCVFKALGFEFCPGCGLGHAVAHLFRGEWAASFAAHPLGPFAVVVLSGRVGSLVRQALRLPDPPFPIQPIRHV